MVNGKWEKVEVERAILKIKMEYLKWGGVRGKDITGSIIFSNL